MVERTCHHDIEFVDRGPQPWDMPGSEALGRGASAVGTSTTTGGGMLLGHKVSDRVAEMRDLPAGIDQRSACRHPDWTAPTIWRSRSRSCARSPTGASRST
jgi:hypothetical protein